MRFRSHVMLSVVLLSAACWHKGPTPVAAFDVERVSPALGEAAEPLLLNDSITVYFSRPVHALTVTPDSVTVVDVNGNPVPGSLATGANWVTFTPAAPLAADLLDGTFRPGEAYRLVLAGFPRPDAVRSVDGARLAGVRSFAIRTAATGAAMGLPAPLRPPVGELPFALNAYDSPQPLPADAPRLQLHFTVPVLPASARPQAFLVKLIRPRRRPVDLVPRDVRVVDSRLDRLHGSTVELDLGSEARTSDGESVLLEEGDFLSVSLANGSDALRDLAGAPPLPACAQTWSVEAGAALALMTWPRPDADGGIGGDDGTAPSFECVAGSVRPRVRVEAGDGALGVFRPTRDTVLRPGEAFDRGDGTEVLPRGGVFAFTAIDVPPGVRVRVDSSREPVLLLACGGIRILGALELVGSARPVPAVQHGVAVRELLDQAGVALVAAGDVRLGGELAVLSPPVAGLSPLTIACAGRIDADAALPVNTVLAIEQGLRPEAPSGVRGQTIVVSTAFTYGLPSGTRLAVAGSSPWLRVGLDRDGGLVRLFGVEGGMRVFWQTTPADPIDAERPDRRPDRVQRPQRARDNAWVPVEPGSFVRIWLEADVAADAPLPALREARLLAR